MRRRSCAPSVMTDKVFIAKWYAWKAALIILIEMPGESHTDAWPDSTLMLLYSISKTASPLRPCHASARTDCPLPAHLPGLPNHKSMSQRGHFRRSGLPHLLAAHRPAHSRERSTNSLHKRRFDMHKCCSSARTAESVQCCGRDRRKGANTMPARSLG